MLTNILGVAKLDYSEFNTYCHAGNASGLYFFHLNRFIYKKKGIVARDFGSGKEIRLSVTLNLITNTLIIESDKKSSTKNLSIGHLNPDKGIRFVVSQTYSKDFVSVGKFFFSN